mmetsp:Transcript_153556/g.268521  ORF Transcript_153556/g.268521 Transcript_153556/m.268521 type:complete len:225 (-) Transcript_153556:87-761(-)
MSLCSSASMASPLRVAFPADRTWQCRSWTLVARELSWVAMDFLSVASCCRSRWTSAFSAKESRRACRVQSKAGLSSAACRCVCNAAVNCADSPCISDLNRPSTSAHFLRRAEATDVLEALALRRPSGALSANCWRTSWALALALRELYTSKVLALWSSCWFTYSTSAFLRLNDRTWAAHASKSAIPTLVSMSILSSLRNASSSCLCCNIVLFSCKIVCLMQWGT